MVPHPVIVGAPLTVITAIVGLSGVATVNPLINLAATPTELAGNVHEEVKADGSTVRCGFA